VKADFILQKVWVLAEIFTSTGMEWGYAGAQLVDALRYQPEGHGFDSRLCHYPSGATVALG